MPNVPLTPDGRTNDSFTAPLSVESQHAAMVKALIKDPQEVANTLTLNKIALLHTALGLAGEVGEIVDCIKKHVFYNQPLKRVFADGDGSIEEEGGDLEFYLEDLRMRTGVFRDSMLTGNLGKLAKRYENYIYSDNAAQVRADKANIKCALCFEFFSNNEQPEVMEGVKLHQACAEAIRDNPSVLGDALRKNFPHLCGETGPKNTQ